MVTVKHSFAFRVFVLLPQLERGLKSKTSYPLCFNDSTSLKLIVSMNQRTTIITIIILCRTRREKHERSGEIETGGYVQNILRDYKTTI